MIAESVYSIKNDNSIINLPMNSKLINYLRVNDNSFIIKTIKNNAITLNELLNADSNGK